jgi:BASS family bile acid:Na+ symporter
LTCLKEDCGLSREKSTPAHTAVTKDLRLDWIQHIAALALPACLVAFMAANLAAIGLELDLPKAAAALRNPHFLVIVLAWDWLLCPGFAWALVRLVPMAEPYAIGLLLIGMAPAAPFLPMMVRKAGGDVAYTAAFLLIGALGTVAFMPLALPLLAPHLTVRAWTIARPLILLLALPFGLGLAVRAALPTVAGRVQPVVKLLANAATLVLLILIVIVYFEGFIAAVGSYAIGTQLLFAIAVTVAAHGMARGLKREQRVVVSLGVCTRNLGAAFAPLQAVSSDPRTTVMVALGVPITLIVSYVAARLLRPSDN